MSASQPGIASRGDSVFIIAEAGVNHNGSIKTALELVRVAVDSGADAVKFQSFLTDELVIEKAEVAPYQRRTGPELQRNLLSDLELSWTDQERLSKECSNLGIEFMSTPFDHASLDFLVNELSVRRLKVASPDLTNGPLLLAAARAGREMIVSTGMADLSEVDRALALLAFGMTEPEGQPTDSVLYTPFSDTKGRDVVQEQVTLLHCTSAYPAPIADVNLRAIPTMREHFGVDVGYSDHTEGETVPLAAAAMGATVLEKHFTLDRSSPGPDHRASLEPRALSSMIERIRELEKALGSAEKRMVASEEEIAPIARRSLVARRKIEPGEPFTPDNIAVRRPGTGRSPMDYWRVLGSEADREYEPGDML